MIRTYALALLALCGLFEPAAVAQQQGSLSTKIFVASTGLDTNSGARSAPMRSFQAAHNSVAPGGEIVVLDTAGYGPVTITKSVGVVVPPGVSGFVTVTASGANGVTINAGANDIVTLSGLIIEGLGPTGGGSGIYSTTVGTLVVEDTTVRNFNEGIQFRGSGSARLIVRRGAVRNTNFGVDVSDAASSATIVAQITDIELTSNLNSIYVGQFNQSSGVSVLARRCNITFGGAGSYAFRAFYVSAVIFVDDCNIASAGSGQGVVFKYDGAADNKGRIYSRQNNVITGDNTYTQGSDPLPQGFPTH